MYHSFNFVSTTVDLKQKKNWKLKFSHSQMTCEARALRLDKITGVTNDTVVT